MTLTCPRHRWRRPWGARTTALAILFCISALICASLMGCGGEGTPAPSVDAEVGPCPTMDEHLGTTLATLRAGEAEQLAGAIETMARTRPEAGEGLMRGLFALLGELWQSGVRDDPTLIRDIVELLEGLTPLLVDIVDYLAVPGATQQDALAAVDGLLATCPERALTDVAAELVARPSLIRALRDTIQDPTVISAIKALPADDGSTTGRDGFVALFRTIVRAIDNPNFVFDDLVALLDPIFDLETPPFSTLLPELQALLTGESLERLRVLTRCLDEQIVVGDGVTGTEAIGALLYDLLTSPEIQLSTRLDELEPALVVLDDPRVRAALTAIVGRLQTDDAIREGMKPAIRYLLGPDVAPGALSDLSTLLEADLLPDLLTLVEGLVSEGCGGVEETP